MGFANRYLRPLLLHRNANVCACVFVPDRERESNDDSTSHKLQHAINFMLTF